MIYAITQFVNFDVEEERTRINECFTGDVLHRQLHIFQLFLDGHYKECYRCMCALPYNDEDECAETEYVCPFISDSVHSMMKSPNIRIEPINESTS